MIKHTGIQRVIGLCHGMQGTVRYLAAVYGDRGLALQALLNDEQINSIEVAERILDELLAAHAEMLPQFMER